MTGTVVRRLETTEPFQVEDIPVDGIAEIQLSEDHAKVLFFTDLPDGPRGRVRLWFTRAVWDQIEADMLAGKCSGRPLTN